MKKPDRRKETIKNVVIVVLILSAVFLGWKSRLFGNPTARSSDLLTFFGVTHSAGGISEIQALTAAARPISIVVTNTAGDHYGLKYDMDEIRSLYGKSVVIFGEALGSAQTPQQVSQVQWRGALQACGVYYEYIAPVPLSVLVGWYGSELSGDWGDFTVRRLCVTAGGNQSRLFFADEATGIYYAADAAASTRVTTLAEAVGINSTVYAFELSDAYEPPGSYTVIRLDVTDYPVIEAVNPLDDADVTAEILRKLGISEHQQSSYTEGNALVFPYKDFTVRLFTDGTLIYTRMGGDEAAEPGAGAAIEAARKVAADTVGVTSGSHTGVYLSAVEALGGDGYHITFDYVVDGGIVLQPGDTHAAEATVRNGNVAEIRLYFRQYTPTDVTVQLLPEIQAAALSGGAFELYYPAADAGRLEPLWG